MENNSKFSPFFRSYQLAASDIVLFEDKSVPKYQYKEHNQLKIFLRFLKSINFSLSAKFAFVSDDGPLLPNLTVKENLLLDAVPSGLTSTKEAYLEKILEESGNENFLEIYSQIGGWDKLPCALNKRSHKLACLLKAMMQDAPLLFIEAPEKNLNSNDLELIIQAIVQEAKQKNKIILLTTTNESIWNPYITKSVLVTENKKFLVTDLVDPSADREEDSKTSSFPNRKQAA